MSMAWNRRPRVAGGVIGLSLGRYAFVGGGVAAAMMALAGPALAGPEGARVVSGKASLTRNGSLTTIEAGNNAIINYSRFNIAAGETVRFIQPSATSRVLNRITGADPSKI